MGERSPEEDDDEARERIRDLERPFHDQLSRCAPGALDRVDETPKFTVPHLVGVLRIRQKLARLLPEVDLPELIEGEASLRRCTAEKADAPLLEPPKRAGRVARGPLRIDHVDRHNLNAIRARVDRVEPVGARVDAEILRRKLPYCRPR